MSYCRAGEHSDVYVFASISGGLECCGCRLYSHLASFSCYTTNEMLLHLKAHRWKGEKVPQGAFDRLKEEQGELDAHMYKGLRDSLKEQSHLTPLQKAVRKYEQVYYWRKPMFAKNTKGERVQINEAPEVQLAKAAAAIQAEATKLFMSEEARL
jgi:hypothetical protein